MSRQKKHLRIKGGKKINAGRGEDLGKFAIGRVVNFGGVKYEVVRKYYIRLNEDIIYELKPLKKQKRTVLLDVPERHLIHAQENQESKKPKKIKREKTSFRSINR